jgi:hypothetical protein
MTAIKIKNIKIDDENYFNLSLKEQSYSFLSDASLQISSNSDSLLNPLSAKIQ